jgi:uncharacterized protein (TIGR03663 family)
MLGTSSQEERDAPAAGETAAPPQGDITYAQTLASAPSRVSWEGLSLGGLTLEMLLYGAILVVALAIRLTGLDLWPLTRVEADTALAAWRTIQGSAWRPAYYLPLVYDANLVLFWLTRATDAATRVLPALAGAGLVLLPYWARDLVGRKAALVAALFLALAPGWVYLSRAADGAILATAASAILLLTAYRAAQSGQSRDFRVGAAALALGLTAGPQFYTTLLALALGLAAWSLAGRRSGGGAQVRAWLGCLATRENGLIFLGFFLFFASGFTLNPGGIGASINLAGRWAQGLSPWDSGLPWFAYPRNLLLYESLALILALVGGIWGIQRRDVIDYVLLAWAGVALLLGIIGHREPLWLLDILLPLVLLAARGAERLWDALLPGAGVADLVILALLVPVLCFGFLQVAAFTQSGETRHLDYARIVLGALLVLWAVYAIWGQRESAQRVGAGLLLLILMAMTLRATTALTFQTGRDPREALVSQPVPSVQMRDLLQEVTTISSRQVGDPHLIDLDYEDSLDPWLGWYLRDYPQSRALRAIEPQPSTLALLTTLRAEDAWPVGYMGQRFRWQETRPEQDLDFRQRLRWFIYRDPLGTIEASEVHLWVRAPAIQSAK